MGMSGPPSTSSNLGVALWLCPRRNSSLYDKLDTLMGSLSTLFPGQLPRFEPHITITTNVAVDLDRGGAHDDVDRILSASVVAIQLLPKHHDTLIRLGRVNSQRQYFKKLYFQVEKDPNLVSFARIIRELFVIEPQKTDAANRQLNPHLYKKTKDHHETKPVDSAAIRAEAAADAAAWSEEYDPHLSLVYSDIHPIDNALWRTIKTRILDYLNIENCDVDEPNGYGWDGGVLKLVLCEGDVNDWVTLGSVDFH